MADKMEKPFGNTLAKLGKEYKNLIVLDADLQRGTETADFAKQFPERYFNLGVAEGNMVCVAAGIALSNKTVFCGTFACFIAQRACDQVAISVAYTRANVKLFGFEPALVSGSNGATHQTMFDLAIMRAMPGMTVFDPVDAIDLCSILEYHAANSGPAYIRAYRKSMPILLDKQKHEFRPGKAYHLKNGEDVTLIACGMMLERALKAAEQLESNGINARVLGISSIKPLDEESVLDSAITTGCIVTAENHNILGGLGSAVAEIVTSKAPIPIVRVGIKDIFGEVGTSNYLAKHFGIGVSNIVQAAKQAIELKILHHS